MKNRSQLIVTGVPIIVGTIFGIALQKSGVFAPTRVINQMLMKDFTMLQIFLAAVGATCIVFGLLSIFFEKKFKDGHSVHFERRRSLLIVALGSLIAGIGMTLSGACPGTIAAQFGSGVSNVLFVITGAMIGAISYGILEPIFHPFLQKHTCRECGLDVLLGVPYYVLTISLGSILLFGMVIVGYFTENLNVPHLEDVTWPLALCGLVIGLIQIPPIIVLGTRGLGASAGYVSVAAITLNTVIEDIIRTIPYLREAASCSFQVLCIGGIALGSFLSAQTSGSFLTIAGVSPLRGLLGGAFVMFGSRLANGCTSGHGITGMGHLAVVSVVAVCGMFGGGIATAMVGEHVLGLQMS